MTTRAAKDAAATPRVRRYSPTEAIRAAYVQPPSTTYDFDSRWNEITRRFRPLEKERSR